MTVIPGKHFTRAMGVMMTIVGLVLLGTVGYDYIIGGQTTLSTLGMTVSGWGNLIFGFLLLKDAQDAPMLEKPRRDEDVYH